MDMVTILKTAVQAGSSDIHICVNKPPMMRLNGQVIPVAEGIAPLTADQTVEGAETGSMLDQPVSLTDDSEEPVSAERE